MLTVGFSSGDISGVANISVFGIFLVYASVNLCMIWYRFKKPTVERPFLAPLSIGKFPVLAGIGLMASIVMLFNKMLSECKENKDLVKAANSKDEFFLAESLFMVLILQQQKTINELIAKVSKQKWKEA